MLSNFETGIIRLINSGLTAEKAILPPDFNLEHLYPIAKMHQIHALLYCGAIACGIKQEDPVMQKPFKGLYSELLTNEKQLNKYHELTALFEEKQIDYMPLKGVLLKELYPQPTMRCMGDIDILIRPSQYQKIKSLLPSLGFHHVVDSDHEYIWRTDDDISLELHKRLIPSYNKDYYAYFGDGWEKAKKEQGTLYTLSPEDNFIYLFTHFAKHYRDGGIGIKHFVDIKLYLEKQKPDQAYICEEFKKLGLYEFYLNVADTIDVWFNGAEGNEKTDLISKTLIRSGTYGSSQGKAAASVLREAAQHPQRKTRFKWLRDLFPPYRAMCEKHAYLKKLPFLLPIAYLIRIAAIVLTPKKITKYLNHARAKTPHKVEEYERHLNAVGLAYHFKE